MTDKHRPPPPTKSAASGRFLCRFDAIADGTSKEVSLPGERNSLCLVRINTAVYAYINSCPHTGAPLNWGNDQFLTRDGDMIQCALHGALFRLADGLCMRGPCLHRQLIAVPVIVRDGDILLAAETDIL